MLDTESVARAFNRYSGSKLIAVLHKTENELYERLGEITLEDDSDRATELSDDVDQLILAINVHLGVTSGRNTSSLRASSASPDLCQSNSLSAYTVSELMSILASLYSVLLDLTIGFSRNETECANKLRILVQRILTTFSPSHTIPRLTSPGALQPGDSTTIMGKSSTISADIRLLDVIAQAERISSLRNTATLLPLFDFALLSVKRLLTGSQTGNKKYHQSSGESQETDLSCEHDSVAVMLKAIVVVRIAKRIFSRHALKHLRALHTSNGIAFPHVGLPLLTAIRSSPYCSELPESAHTSVDELRSFLLDHTSCTDELMERILCFMTRSSDSDIRIVDEMEIEETHQDSSVENEFTPDPAVKHSEVSLGDTKESETADLPEKKRKIATGSRPGSSADAPLANDRLQTKQDSEEIPDHTSGEMAAEDDNTSQELVVVDDSDLIELTDEDEDIPLDQLRHRRPKSVDSTISQSWASVSFEPSSDQGIIENSSVASPSPSNSTANGSSANGNDGDASSVTGGTRRRSARLSTKNKSGSSQ